MLNYDFLLNIPLKIFGLVPIFPRKYTYLKYASYIYTGVVLLFVIFGEYDYIQNVYIDNVFSDVSNVNGLIKYTYLARDLIAVICTTVNLIETQVLVAARGSAELKFVKLDKDLNLKLKGLRNSVICFVVYFPFWILISLINVILMKPRSFSRLLSLTVSTIDAFTIIDFIDKLYLRFSEINMQLESLIMDCKEVNKIKGIFSESRDIQRIRVLGKCHVKLCQTIDEMRGNYGLSMIFVLLVIMMNSISFSIYFLVGGINERNLEVLIRYAVWVTLHLMLAYFLLYKGTQLSDEAYSIRNIIWNNIRPPLEPEIASELEILILKTEHSNYRIDCGYFELSLDTFGPMANSILTQVVIIYTFQ